MTPSLPQIRPARALLGWSQSDLARAAGVALSTIADFERGARDPVPATLGAVVRILEEKVEFVPRGVVRRAVFARASSD